MKYFKRSLLRQESHEPRIVASFFYSDKEGEAQANHHNMLRSVLYDILDQNEEFFLHYQSYYRQANMGGGYYDPQWSYESLKGALLSIAKNHPVSKRLYLIIDAVDEGDYGERTDAIRFLYELCAAKGQCIVKAFVSSRPATGLHSHLTRNKMIRLQDVNYSDILKFTKSFLDDPVLGLPPDIAHSTLEYITQNALGVFVWVRLVTEELLRYYRAGRNMHEIFDFLRSLPIELEEMYKQMLRRIDERREQNVEIGQNMLQLVLFAYRPLRLDEFRQALAIQDSLDYGDSPVSDEFFEMKFIHGIEKCIISATGNFLEIKHQGDHGSCFSQSILWGVFS